jgi:hypothetical protein
VLPQNEQILIEAFIRNVHLMREMQASLCKSFVPGSESPNKSTAVKGPMLRVKLLSYVIATGIQGNSLSIFNQLFICDWNARNAFPFKSGIIHNAISAGTSLTY